MIIDISYHQRPEQIDYDKISGQVDGVILRAAYGTGAPGKFDGADPVFKRHYDEFHKRGIPLGAYHFITEYQNIDKQAQIFIEAVKGLDLSLGYWCDAELEEGAEKLTAKNVIRWMELVEARLGTCGIYTGKWCWSDIMGSEYARYSSRRLWMSAYVSDPVKYIPPGWNDYDLWQYTSSGRLDGYNGNLDMSKKGTRMTDILLSIEPLAQRDPRWKDYQLGTSNKTIGSHGCVITDATMLSRYLGIDIDPAGMNAWLKANNGYQNSNWFVWSILKNLDSRISFGYRYNYAATDKIDAQLLKKMPSIVNVDLIPSTSYLDEHWVLVVGKINGSYIINDPWYGTQFKFEEKYGDPRTGMRIVCTYNFAGELNPLSPITSPPVETALYQIKVRDNITKLLIRSTPEVNSFNVLPGYASGKYSVFEEKNGYGRIGINRWISINDMYVEKVTSIPEDGEIPSPSDVEKLSILWNWYKKSN